MKHLLVFLIAFSISSIIFPQDLNYSTVMSGTMTDPATWGGEAPMPGYPWNNFTFNTGHIVTMTQDFLGQNLDFNGGSLVFANGSTITITGGVYAETGGDYFFPNTGTVVMDNTWGSGYLSGPPGYPWKFYNLVVKQDLSAYNDVEISGGVYLDGASLFLNKSSPDHATATFLPGATVTNTGGFGVTNAIYVEYYDQWYHDYGEVVIEILPTTGTLHHFLPLGTTISGTRSYTPAEFSYTAAAINPTGGSVTVRAKNQKHPSNNSPNHYIERYWEASLSGISGVNGVFTGTFSSDDIVGDIMQMYSGRYNYMTSAWELGGPVYTTSQIITATFDFSSDFTAGEQGSLPIELISFTALNDDEDVLLNWTTATEVNNYGFEVERKPDKKVNTNETPKWEMLTFIEGHGNTNAQRKYKYTDSDVPSGTYYYRLRQIDTDGGFSYSEEIKIDVGNIPRGFELNQNYPNPFNHVTIITFSTAQKTKAVLKVFNSLGEEVETIFEGIVQPNKLQKVEFDASNYASGVYYYKLSTQNRTDSKKMILLK